MRGRGFVALILSAAIFSSHADQLTYQYDELGRLIEVKAAPVKVIHYDYDASGNLQTISSNALATLSIAGFSPSRAPIGASVVISGSAFSNTFTSNTVKVNGTAATVTAASNTSLTITVPPGATSGPISITVGASTVTSTDPFVVTNDQPTITGFTPTSGPAGTTVTLTGTNFSTTAANDQVTFGGTQAAAPVSPTATQIKVLVPAGAGSGHIGLTTPGGSVFSAGDFIATPTGTWPTGCTTPSSYGASTRVALGTTQTSLTLAASQAVPVVFQANAGQYLTLATSSMTSANVSLALRGPQGDFVAIGNATTCATLVPANTGLELPRLPDTGTYTLFVTAPGAGTIKLAVEPPITGALTVGAAATPIAFTAPARRALETFSLGSSQYVTVTASAVSVSGGTLAVLDASGRSLVSAPLSKTQPTVLSPQLPAGDYSVLVDPSDLSSGSVSLAVASAAAVPLQVNGSASTALAGANSTANVTFDGKAGQRLTLVTATTTAMSQAYSFTVKVSGPDGVQVASGTLSSAGGATTTSTLTVPVLGTTGMYTVALADPATAAYTGTIQLTLTRPLTTPSVLGVGSSVTMGSGKLLGQGVQVNVNLEAGEQATITASHSYSSGSYTGVLTILSPSGDVLATKPLSATPSGSTSLGVNPGVSGTYTAVLQQTGATTVGTESFSLSGPIDGTVLTINGQASAQLAALGPTSRLYFDATIGDTPTFAVGISGAASSSYQAQYALTTPSGVSLASGVLQSQCPTMYSSFCSKVINFAALPETGRYRIVFTQPTGQTSGQVTFVLSTPADLGNFGAPPYDMNETTGQIIGLLPGQGWQYRIAASGSGGAAFVLSPKSANPLLNTTVTSTGPGTMSTAAGRGYALVNTGFATVSGTYTVVTKLTEGYIRAPFAYNYAVNSTAPSNTTRASENAFPARGNLFFDGQGASLTYYNATATKLNLGLTYTVNSQSEDWPGVMVFNPVTKTLATPRNEVGWTETCVSTGSPCTQWARAAQFSYTPGASDVGTFYLWAKKEIPTELAYSGTFTPGYLQLTVTNVSITASPLVLKNTPASLSAKVEDASTGKITFYKLNADGSMNSLGPALTMSNGQASMTYTFTTSGIYNVVAQFDHNADGSYSLSLPATIVVQ